MFDAYPTLPSQPLSLSGNKLLEMFKFASEEWAGDEAGTGTVR